MNFDGFEDILSDIKHDNDVLEEQIHEVKAKNAIDINKLQQQVFQRAEDDKQINKKSTSNNVHAGHRQRARERFLNNPDAISDYDLLELILFLIIPRTDTKQLAKKLIDRYKTLKNLCNVSTVELNNNGVNGEAFKYIMELVSVIQKRILQQKINDETTINNFKSLVEYCQTSLARQQEEQFRILFFDSKNTLLEDIVFGFGNISTVSVPCREILKKCIEIKANSVVMYHNHPNQNVLPSQDDIDTTNKIIETLSIIDVDVADHLIVSGDKYFSFKQEGII